jgi:hypothetical protein
MTIDPNRPDQPADQPGSPQPVEPQPMPPDDPEQQPETSDERS